MDYRFAICTSLEDAEQLNDYIKDRYYHEVDNASMDKWTDIIPYNGKFALEIMDFMQYRPVPEFLVNGVEFVDDVPRPIIEIENL